MDGLDSGTIQGSRTKVTLRVSGSGRLLTRLKTSVGGFCVGGSPSSNYVTVLIAYVPRAAIRADGSSREGTGRRGTPEIVYRGRLNGSRVAGGYVEMNVGTCAGNAHWSARRIGA